MFILNARCKCGLTLTDISEGEFSCQKSRSEEFMRASESEEESINYRARIKGTNNRSASDLVALLQSWVQSGEASINIQSVRYYLHPNCETTLDNIHALNCGTQPLTPPPSPSPATKPPTEPQTKGPTEDKNVGGKDNSGGSNSAQVGGIILGGIIAGALLVMIVLIVVVIILWKKSPK